jgi:hypothetical protein
MNTPRFAILSLGFLLTAAASHAVNLVLPSDPVIGGAIQASNFVVGVVGTNGGVNNWPGAELPTDLTNGLIGGDGEKYLNFLVSNTGVIISPSAGSSIINTMTLWVANDESARDPASYELYGTNAPIAGPGPFPVAGFSLISSGALALPDTRDTVTDTTGFNQIVPINAANAFASYMLVFPTVKNPGGANSMQLSEVTFDATIVPEPSVALLGALGALGVAARRRRN